jgi:hypothetical protein
MAETGSAGSGDDLKVIIQWIDPTPAQRERMEHWWRGVVGRLLNEQGDEPGKLSEP